jgi:hypothetical protein
MQAALLLATEMGALGASVGALHSFANLVGDGKFIVTWTWWFAIKPLFGASMGVIFTIIVFGSVGEPTQPQSYYRIAAISGFVGLFADVAYAKLMEIFSTLLRPKDDRHLGQ